MVPSSAASDRPVRILFVCLANLCRSPIAKAVADTLHAGRIVADCAGLSPVVGPPYEEAVTVVRRLYGVDLSGHRPKSFLEFPLLEYDYIIAMDSKVFLRLQDFPAVPKDRLYGWEVADPCGLGAGAYEQAAREIERDLERFLFQRHLERPSRGRRP